MAAGCGISRGGALRGGGGSKEPNVSGFLCAQSKYLFDDGITYKEQREVLN